MKKKHKNNEVVWVEPDRHTKCSMCGMLDGKHKMSCKTPSLREDIKLYTREEVENIAIKAINFGASESWLEWLKENL